MSFTTTREKTPPPAAPTNSPRKKAPHESHASCSSGLSQAAQAGQDATGSPAVSSRGRAASAGGAGQTSAGHAGQLTLAGGGQENEGQDGQVREQLGHSGAAGQRCR